MKIPLTFFRNIRFWFAIVCEKHDIDGLGIYSQNAINRRNVISVFFSGCSIHVRFQHGMPHVVIFNIFRNVIVSRICIHFHGWQCCCLSNVAMTMKQICQIGTLYCCCCCSRCVATLSMLFALNSKHSNIVTILELYNECLCPESVKLYPIWKITWYVCQMNANETSTHKMIPSNENAKMWKMWTVWLNGYLTIGAMFSVLWDQGFCLDV